MFYRYHRKAILAHFDLASTTGRTLIPKRSLAQSFTDLVGALEAPARLGPALDAALDILLHGALLNDQGPGRDLSEHRLEGDVRMEWDATLGSMARGAQHAVDDLTDYLVDAVPRPVYEVLKMVLAQGFERYLALDQDLHPVDVLGLFEIYNKARAPRSCIIAALARSLSAATPPDDPAALGFAKSYCDDAKDYWNAFDFSDRASSPALLRELAPFLGLDPASRGDRVRASITELSTGLGGPEEAVVIGRAALGLPEALSRLHEREKGLLKSALSDREELVRVRGRCTVLEEFLAECMLREDEAAERALREELTTA